MAEDKGFRDMISTFNPKYNLPSRTYFTQLMEKKHRDITEKLKAVLKQTECVALKTDIWTSVATEAYLGVKGYNSHSIIVYNSFIYIFIYINCVPVWLDILQSIFIYFCSQVCNLQKVQSFFVMLY